MGIVMQVMQTITINCGPSQPPLEIIPATTYRIVAPDSLACARLVREALRIPEVELVPRNGGLLSNLSVSENIMLPAVYHGRLGKTDAEERVYGELEMCGVARDRAEALCTRSVSELNNFERRLTVFVRCLLMCPPVLVMERTFERLTTEEMRRVGQFADLYRERVPEGSVIMLDIAGAADANITCDHQVHVQ